MIAADGLAAVGRMIAAYRRSDGAATYYKIAWLTVALRDLEGHRRCLSPDGFPRIGGCGPMWSGGRSPGYVAAPASLLALAAWQSGNGAM